MSQASYTGLPGLFPVRSSSMTAMLPQGSEVSSGPAGNYAAGRRVRIGSIVEGAVSGSVAICGEPTTFMPSRQVTPLTG